MHSRGVGVWEGRGRAVFLLLLLWLFLFLSQLMYTCYLLFIFDTIPFCQWLLCNLFLFLSHSVKTEETQLLIITIPVNCLFPNKHIWNESIEMVGYENKKSMKTMIECSGSWRDGGVVVVGGGTFLKSLVSGRGMQRSRLPVIPLFLVHFASVFPEVFVALDVQLHQVADFDRVDLPGTAVADLRQNTVWL